MKTITHQDHTYIITEQSPLKAVSAQGKNRVRILNQQPNGEITVQSRQCPWLNQTLKSMEVQRVR